MTERSKPKRKDVQRLSAALRENLKRRKAQDKARRARETAVDRTGAAHDSAGIGKENSGD